MEKIEYNAMLSRIQKEIISSKAELEKLLELDNKYCKRKIQIDKMIEIIESYKKLDIENISKEIIIMCNGNPYIVLNIAMISIVKNVNIRINIDDTMLGTNKLILQIINKILKENGLNIKIELTQEVNGEIFIDRINDFNLGNKQKSKYIPYESIDIYSDGIQFEELYEKIYNYAIDLNIDIDIFDDENIDSMIKYGKGKRKIILTNDKKIIEKYKEDNIYINENPFKEDKIMFDEEMISKIIN